MSPVPVDPAELRAMELFDGLGHDELTLWAAYAAVEDYEPGQLIRAEGAPPSGLMLLLDGIADAIGTASPADPVLVQSAPTFMGAVASLTGEPSAVRLVAQTRCRIGLVPIDDFRRLVHDQPLIFRRVTAQIAPTMRRETEDGHSRHRLASLGQMAAGLAHELGNPAAAAGRSITELADALETIGSTLGQFVHAGVERAEAEEIVALQRLAVERATGRTRLDALDAADLEDELRDHLESIGTVREPWRLAESLAAAGVDREWVDGVAGLAGPATSAALEWVAATLRARQLVADIQDCTTRMVELVSAVKSYSYMDRAELLQVDLHEGLESTLTILGHKLRSRGTRVIREYDRGLPLVTVHGAELNQVWTNLIDNAIDAVGDAGTITIRTCSEGSCAITEISDDGPGIPDQIVERIFDPFYTTKEIGKGTGLGLAVSQRIVVDRHRGSLTLTTGSGGTTFRVRVPVAPKPA